jgi:transglutaminase-like putative cysteine protease
MNRFPRPAEGWPALGLILVMALTVAWAIDDVAWVNGRSDWTDLLAICAIMGVLVGFIGVKVGWSRWLTHLMGAVFAALTIPILTGWALEPGISASGAFQLTAEGSANAYLDLVWRGRRVTPEVAHFILILGMLTWGTAQFASYAVFGHRRPLNAVVMLGLILVTNMALTIHDQLVYLVLFSTASLFLLIGMHAFDERAAWVRRRIGDPGAVSGLYLRGGTAFIVVAIAGSLVLTDRASSAPLARAWDNLDQRVLEAAQGLQRFLPDPGDGVRPFSGVSFGSTSVISGRWEMDAGVAFRTKLPSTLKLPYWRAATYDTFDLTAWTMSDDVRSIPVDRDQPLLEGTAELPDESLVEPITFTIRPDTYRESLILSPASPMLVDRDVRVQVLGDDGWFSSVTGVGRDPYTVTAWVSKLGDDAININRLRQAGRDYPAEIVERYTAVPAEALPDGGDALALLDEIRARVGSDNPYDLAKEMRDVLQSPLNFEYDTNVQDLDCGPIGVVECFARYRRGYCQHYASTMAILLREAGIPTRLAQGFLPGERALATGEETVFNRRAHAWVEVYFPGSGWQPFDPTGGGLPSLPELPLGPSDVDPTPAPSLDPRPTRAPEATEPPASVPPGGAGGPVGGGGSGGYVAIAMVLALIVLGFAGAAWWRGPRGQVSPEAAWSSMERLAARFGFARRPTQTTYEYASALGDLVPVARPDLETVAQARVEARYGRSPVVGDRLQAIQEATRRLRVTLLRLALRRRGSGRRR